MRMQMKGWLLAVVLLGAFLFATPAQAQASRDPGSLGVGVGAGTVVAGLSLKKPLGGSTAVQGVVGTFRGYGRHYGFYSDAFGLSADFLVEQPALVTGRVLSLGWNYGAGAGIGLGNGTTILGVTGVLGLEFNFVPAPIDFVLEYRPGLYIGAGYGDSDVGLSLIDFTGHIRVWF